MAAGRFLLPAGLIPAPSSSFPRWRHSQQFVEPLGSSSVLFAHHLQHTGGLGVNRRGNGSRIRISWLVVRAGRKNSINLKPQKPKQKDKDVKFDEASRRVRPSPRPDRSSNQSAASNSLELEAGQAIGRVISAQANYMRVLVTRCREADGELDNAARQMAVLPSVGVAGRRDGGAAPPLRPPVPAEPCEARVGSELLCVVRSLLKKLKRRVLVGDDVVVSGVDWTSGRGMVEDVLPRRSQIVDPPIANVDHLVLLFSVARPPLEPLNLSRFLVAAEDTGVLCSLVLNKVELVGPEVLEEWRSRLQGWGYAPLFCSVETGAGLEAVEKVMRGRVSVVAGPSGVGKSSLINALRSTKMGLSAAAVPGNQASASRHRSSLGRDGAAGQAGGEEQGGGRGGGAGSQGVDGAGQSTCLEAPRMEEDGPGAWGSPGGSMGKRENHWADGTPQHRVAERMGSSTDMVNGRPGPFERARPGVAEQQWSTEEVAASRAGEAAGGAAAQCSGGKVEDSCGAHSHEVRVRERRAGAQQQSDAMGAAAKGKPAAGGRVAEEEMVRHEGQSCLPEDHFGGASMDTGLRLGHAVGEEGFREAAAPVTSEALSPDPGGQVSSSSGQYKELRVGDVSDRSGRGRHTTRHVELLNLPAGGLLADSPGFSQPSLATVASSELASLFPEVRRASGAQACAFSDCRHTGEPGCAVGTQWERFPHYAALLEEVRLREVLEKRAIGTKRESDVRFKTGAHGVQVAEPRLVMRKHRRVSRKSLHQTLEAELLEANEDEGEEPFGG